MRLYFLQCSSILIHIKLPLFTGTIFKPEYLATDDNTGYSGDDTLGHFDSTKSAPLPPPFGAPEFGTLRSDEDELIYASVGPPSAAVPYQLSQQPQLMPAAAAAGQAFPFNRIPHQPGNVDIHPYATFVLNPEDEFRAEQGGSTALMLQNAPTLPMSDSKSVS